MYEIETLQNNFKSSESETKERWSPTSSVWLNLGCWSDWVERCLNVSKCVPDLEHLGLIGGLMHSWRQHLNRPVQMWKAGPIWRKCVLWGSALTGSPWLWSFAIVIFPCSLAVVRWKAVLTYSLLLLGCFWLTTGLKALANHGRKHHLKTRSKMSLAEGFLSPPLLFLFSSEWWRVYIHSL